MGYVPGTFVIITVFQLLGVLITITREVVGGLILGEKANSTTGNECKLL